MDRQKMPTFVTMTEVQDMLATWWEDRQARYMQAAALASGPMGRDKGIVVLMDLLSDHGEQLGWVNEQWPDIKDLRQQAEAIVSAAILAETKDIGWRVMEILIKGKCHQLLQVEGFFERLSRSLVHRMEALRTLISAEKELAGQFGRGGLQEGNGSKRTVQARGLDGKLVKVFSGVDDEPPF